MGTGSGSAGAAGGFECDGCSRTEPSGPAAPGDPVSGDPVLQPAQVWLWPLQQGPEASLGTPFVEDPHLLTGSHPSCLVRDHEQPREGHGGTKAAGEPSAALLKSPDP